MDKFLESHQDGKLINSENSFTVDPMRAQSKLLSSVPKGQLYDALNLLELALIQLADIAGPNNGLGSFPTHTEYFHDLLLPKAPEAEVKKFIEATRNPFGTDGPWNTLVKAIFQLANSKVSVGLGWSLSRPSPPINPMYVIRDNGLYTPDDAPLPVGPGLLLRLHRTGLLQRHPCEGLLCEQIYPLIKETEVIEPVSHAKRPLEGYYSYRCHPFSALRTYATLPPDRTTSEMFFFHLKPGSYERIDQQTVLLSKGSRFSWKSFFSKLAYGRPTTTVMHHHLQSELAFKQQSCQAMFAVGSTEKVAHVHLVSDAGVSPAIPVEGPRGLHGVVIWPGLIRDLWGIRLVEDDNYQAALEWTGEQIRATTEILDRYRPQILEQLDRMGIIKSHYREELFNKIALYWQPLTSE